MKPIVKAKGLFVTLLYCFMSNEVMLASGRPTPTLMLEENIYAEETPKRVVLHFFNTTQYEISFADSIRLRCSVMENGWTSEHVKTTRVTKSLLNPIDAQKKLYVYPSARKGYIEYLRI